MTVSSCVSTNRGSGLLVFALLIMAFLVNSVVLMGGMLAPPRNSSNQITQRLGFLCGDADGSGDRNVGDAVYFINYIFNSGAAPQDEAHGDYDCDNLVSIADVVYLISWIFSPGPAPCEGPVCVQGELLTGNPGSPAIEATIDLPTSLISPKDIVDGRSTTRLEAILNPLATVQDVNDALTGAGVKINWMQPQSLFLTLLTPRLVQLADAEALATQLQSSGAFLRVVPAYVPDFGANSLFELPGYPAGQGLTHFEKQRFPAAWNARSLAALNDNPSAIVIADAFGATTPHSEINGQVFLSSGIISTDNTGGAHYGNHGYQVSGMAAANFDSAGSTGATPVESSLREVYGFLIGGYPDWPQLMSDLANALPASGSFVLNTSFGWDDSAFVRFPRMSRALDALYWRSLVAPRQSDFLHIAAAGNYGRHSADDSLATFIAPWAMAARFTHPFEMIVGSPATPADSQTLVTLYSAIIGSNPVAADPLTNVLLVGSSDYVGDEDMTSNKKSDVRMIGETVRVPCQFADSDCSPDIEGLLYAQVTGTSFAAPQVAGLASYMLNLAPTLTGQGIKERIVSAFNGKWVDAYQAILSIDQDVFDANVRRTVLDVVDGTGSPGSNQTFDQLDIEVLLAKFKEYDSLRLADGFIVDHSRWDLNGDGFTGDDNIGIAFDLSIDYPPQFSIVTQMVNDSTREFDENWVSDRDLVCYYAYTSLYQGDAEIRDSLLVDCPACNTVGKAPNDCPSPWVMEVQFPAYLVTSSSADLIVRVGKKYFDSTFWQPGIEITISPTNCSPASLLGTTDADGYFRTLVTKDVSEAQLLIDIDARLDGSVLATASVSAWLNANISITRRQSGWSVAGDNSHIDGPMSGPVSVSRSGSFEIPSCEGVFASGTMSQNNNLIIDPQSGTLTSIEFQCQVSGSFWLPDPENCGHSGTGTGSLTLEFTIVGAPVAFEFTPDADSVVSGPGYGRLSKFTLWRYPSSSNDVVFRQRSSGDPEPFHSTSGVLIAAPYKIIAETSATGMSDHLDFTLTFSTPPAQGASTANLRIKSPSAKSAK